VTGVADTLLVVNAGSSSIKFQLFQVGDGNGPTLAFRGQIEGIGTRPHLIAKDAAGGVLIEQLHGPGAVGDVAAALDQLDDWLIAQLGGKPPMAIGHRVVHGGPDYSAPTLIDDAVLEALERLVPLAPLHQSNNLAPIRAVRRRYPQIRQVACFDTAFHRRHPELADRYAIPEAYFAEGVRRYGFHGRSYEYVAGRLRELAPGLAEGRVVVCHLGSGASMCAIHDGCSMDSTMGFTAVDGLPMDTRTGQLDPGVVLYLIQNRGFSAEQVERFLYHESGLKGLSGISNDMRDLEASGAPGAKLTIDYFVYRVVREAGALAAAMGGIDGLVFTAGIGEHSTGVRAAVVGRLGWLGAALDEAANAEGRILISTPESEIAVLVVPTDEELMIARHTLHLLRPGP
jgi:acetate kinase